MYNRGDNDNEKDNKQIINSIVNLRVEKAQLLGYESHAHFILEENMAKTPENVYKLLNEVWDYALPQAKKEAAELQALIDVEGGNFKLASWDWWYYTEKLRQQKYALNEEEVKPYFKMENVREGVFEVANRLFGLSFKKLENVPIYHPEVEAYEVLDADGSPGRLLYRLLSTPGQERGCLDEQLPVAAGERGENIRPLIYNVGNFTRPTATTPALLTLDEVETLFHEFGHALHGMLSNVNYVVLRHQRIARLRGVALANHGALLHPEVLKLYAKHYETGR